MDPKEMPAFLNEVASTYFKDKPEIADKIVQCSVYFYGLLMSKPERNPDCIGLGFDPCEWCDYSCPYR